MSSLPGPDIQSVIAASQGTSAPANTMAQTGAAMRESQARVQAETTRTMGEVAIARTRFVSDMAGILGDATQNAISNVIKIKGLKDWEKFLEEWGVSMEDPTQRIGKLPSLSKRRGLGIPYPGDPDYNDFPVYAEDL